MSLDKLLRDAQRFDMQMQAQRQTELLREQNALMEQARQEAEEAQERAQIQQLFQQGKAKLSELERYAAERNLVSVFVDPALGRFGDYTGEIVSKVTKPFWNFCEQLEKEDRCFNGEDYSLVFNRTITLGVIKDIAQTHKESFAIVPDNGVFYVLPLAAIKERAGEGYDGKSVSLPSISKLLFLKADELPVVAQMLADAKKTGNDILQAIMDSPDIKYIENRLKNETASAIEPPKVNFFTGVLWAIGGIIGGTIIGAIAAPLSGVSSMEDVIGFAISGAILGVILGVVAFKQKNKEGSEKKAQDWKNEQLRQKKNLVSNIISSFTLRETSISTALKNKNA